MSEREEESEPQDGMTVVFPEVTAEASEVAVLRAVADSLATSVRVTPLSDSPSPKGATFDAGPLADGLRQIAAMSRAPSEALFKVTVPAGQTIENLVPAIGGGFRGITKSAGSSTFSGAARLQKVVPASAGGASLLAFGPLVGVIALGVAADMLANRQLNRRLEAISKSVGWLVDVRRRERQAELESAGQALREAAFALLDGANPSSLLGVDAAVHVVRSRANEARARILHWEETIAWIRGSKSFDGPELLDSLVTRDASVAEFVHQVTESHVALLLEARRAVLAEVQAKLLSPDQSLVNLRAALGERLAEVADFQDRLRSLLGELSSLPMGTGFFTSPGTDQRCNFFRAAIGGLHAALVEQQQALPILDGSQNIELKFVRGSDGAFALAEPVSS